MQFYDNFLATPQNAIPFECYNFFHFLEAVLSLCAVSPTWCRLSVFVGQAFQPGFPACRFRMAFQPPTHEHRTGKSCEPAGWKAKLESQPYG
jgi:hypothetical protein